MAKILITGSSGLIGTAVTPLLRNAEHEVVGIDRRSGLHDCRIADIRLAGVFDDLFDDVDGVIHLAAVSRVIVAEQNPGECFETNVAATMKLLRDIYDSKRRPWIIFASSREVYGECHNFPVREDAPCIPVNIYGHSKMAAESAFISARYAGVKTAIVRFSNVYGAINDHATRVIPAFISTAISGGELRIEGADNVFDFVHINDAARGLASLVDVMQREKQAPPTIHFVTGRGTTLQQLAISTIGQAGSGSYRIFPSRSFDVSRFYGDPSRAKSELGWHAEVSLEQGLKQYVAEMHGAALKQAGAQYE